MAGNKGETVAGSGNECIRNPIECDPPFSWDVNKTFPLLYAVKQRWPTEGIEGIHLHKRDQYRVLEWRAEYEIDEIDENDSLRIYRPMQDKRERAGCYRTR
jgi:hypothetical protein